jgi:hypothetical protein
LAAAAVVRGVTLQAIVVAMEALQAVAVAAILQVAQAALAL